MILADHPTQLIVDVYNTETQQTWKAGQSANLTQMAIVWSMVLMLKSRYEHNEHG